VSDSTLRLSHNYLKRPFRLGVPLCMALVAATILVCSSVRSPAYSSSLWGNLKPGPHRVGFRTLLTYDLSRPPVANASGIGKASVRGRQMQINVWYPARAARRASSMRFGDYVHLLAQELEFGPLNAVRKQQGETKFIEQPSELGGNAAALKAVLPMLLGLEMAAIRNSQASTGSFPLIVFPDYRAPATNSIMCEYLASYGFVVATTTLKGTYESELDVALTGVETIAVDISFVIATLKALPMVDPERLALMGVGITASGCLAVLTRNPQVDALISLDGGIPTPFEDRLLKRTPYFDISAVRVPLLAIHAPHPNVDPNILDQYKYSTQHRIHFPQMSEFHFLNYGMLERFAPEIIGKPPGDTRAGFEWASLYVLNFLNAYLKQDASGHAFLRSSPEANSVPRGLLSVKSKVGLKPPPTLSELKAITRKGGVQSLAAVYQQLKAEDPQPFTQETIVALFNWLSYQKDPDWKARRALSVIRLDSYPDSARAHFTMAQVSVQLRETDLARKHFNEALRLLDSDADPLLDFQTRRRIEQAAKQGLKNLES
jgi:hypothetical protein